MPKTIADERNVLEARAVLFGLKDSAQQRLNTKQRKDIPGKPLSHQSFRVATASAQVEKVFNASGDVLEYLLCFAISVVGRGEFFARETIARTVLIKRNEAARIAIWKRTQENGIHDAEDCRRGTDTKSQGQNRNHRKTRTLAQHTRAEA